MLPSAYGLGQYFQDLGYSFSPYGPPSRQITYMYRAFVLPTRHLNRKQWREFEDRSKTSRRAGGKASEPLTLGWTTQIFGDQNRKKGTARILRLRCSYGSWSKSSDVTTWN